MTFKHYSVREFLLSHSNPKSTQSNLLQAHKLLAKTCILLLEPGKRKVPVHAFLDYSSCQQEVTGPASTLLDYAICNWSIHYRIAESYDQMLPGLLQRSITNTLQHNYNHYPALKKDWDFQVSNTTLRICASQGLVSLAQMYLDMGVYPDNTFCEFCDTPLHIASARGHAGLVAILLRNKASVLTSTHTRGETALHLAAAHGSLDTIKILLANDAEVNATDRVSKRTPLHAAAAFGRLDLVKLLMDYVVDVNTALTQTRETPLHLAVLGGHLHVVKYMLDGVCASFEELALYDSVVRKPYFQKWSENLLAGYDDSENTRFFYYDARQDMQEILTYSKKRANINTSTREGWTALHLAAIKGHDAVLQLLIDKGADIAAKGKDQRTPLELAAENGYSSIVKHLIAAGADLNMDADRRPLMLRRIIEKGHHEIADLLMWNLFITEVAGETNNWPVTNLATLGHQHTVQSAVNKMWHTETS